MNNPFKYGEAVIGKTFTNRTKEIKDIISCINSAQNIFIYAARRQGKTSLIKNVVAKLGKSVIPIYVDLERVTSISQFIEVYSEAISSPILLYKQGIKTLAKLFTQITPSVEISPHGGFKASFSFAKTSQQTDKALEEIINLPQKLSKETGKRVLVIFDEFQEIENFGGIMLEKKLRSFIQHHNEVCYVFMGSKTHIILDIFSNPNRPFYKSSKIYPLPEMEADSLIKYIEEGFFSTGKKISKELTARLVTFCNRHPYFVQLFSHTLWELSNKEVKFQDLNDSIKDILLSQSELYYNWYDSLTIPQRSLLKALSANSEIYSEDVRISFNLGAKSTIQSSVNTLRRKGFVDKSDKGYKILDPFFILWLQKEATLFSENITYIDE